MNAHTQTPRDAKGRFIRQEPTSGCTLLEIVESSYEGGTLRCYAQALAGPRAHQPFWFGLPLEGPDAQMGQAAFAELRRAVGVLDPKDSSEIHFKPFSAVVAVVNGSTDVTAFEAVTLPIPPQYERMAKERIDLEGELAMLEIRWALLQPAIEDAVGSARGSGDYLLKDHPEAADYHVLTKMEAEVLDFHLRELGTMIDRISDINRGRATAN